jgi:hypothetical protein
MINEIVRALKSRPLPLNDEKELQAEISKLLESRGIPHKREVGLGDGDVIDFMLPDGIGMEIKIKAPKRQIYRQCKRYCGHAQLRTLVLVSATAMGLPVKIDGKDCYYVSLGAGWL